MSSNNLRLSHAGAQGFLGALMGRDARMEGLGEAGAGLAEVCGRDPRQMHVTLRQPQSLRMRGWRSRVRMPGPIPMQLYSSKTMTGASRTLWAKSATS